jgi:hypothetical protein
MPYAGDARPSPARGDELAKARKRIEELEAAVELSDPSQETLTFLRQARRGLLGALKALERFLDFHAGE